MDQTPAPTRYQGFSLKSVCWGYREIFREAIEGLFREGLIGPDRRQVTAAVFDLLRRADQSHFDHVLKEFLGALNPRTRWLVELPGLFADVVELGGRLGRAASASSRPSAAADWATRPIRSATCSPTSAACARRATNSPWHS